MYSPQLHSVLALLELVAFVLAPAFLAALGASRAFQSQFFKKLLTLNPKP